MNKYKHYKDAEDFLIRKVIFQPDFITDHTYEIIGTGFILLDPRNNTNPRSNYEYADEFFNWMMGGDKELSDKLLMINPWVKRFTDSANLPGGFSATYGWKIKNQMDIILEELRKHPDSRRAYINILLNEDKVVLTTKTTHEFPCTIGIQFFFRDSALHAIVNMRSNNVYSVMPYDVYNFTMLQQYVAEQLKVELGVYVHQINSAHMYKGDVRRVKETLFTIKNEEE